MPDSAKVGGLRVAYRRSAQERKSCAIVISGDDLGEFCILDSERRASVFRLGPMQAAVLGYGDLGVSIHVDVTEIDRVVAAGRNRRVTAGADALGIGHGSHHPAQSVVGRDSHSWPANAVRVHAPHVWNVSCTVRRDADVPVQTTASAGSNRAVNTADGGEEVDGNAWPEGEAAIIAPRT